MELPAVYAQFGPRLSLARQMAKLTQAELARRVGLSRASIANIEAGKQRVFLDQVLDLVRTIDGITFHDLVPDLPEGEDARKGGMILTGAKKLSRQQEQMLSQILASVGDRP